MSQPWVEVEACTLPTAERPLRLAEFDELFARHLVEVSDRTDTTATMLLADAPGLADRVADLTARETECCSFFTFGIDRAGNVVRLDIVVPGEQAAVLDALVARAVAANE